MDSHRGIPGQLAIATQEHDGGVVVRLEGELDSNESLKLRPVLLDLVAKRVPMVVVNLSGLGFIDSAGIATLIECLQGTRSVDARFRLCGMNEQIRTVFEVARLDTVFRIFETEDDALKA